MKIFMKDIYKCGFMYEGGGGAALGETSVSWSGSGAALFCAADSARPAAASRAARASASLFRVEGLVRFASNVTMHRWERGSLRGENASETGVARGCRGPRLRIPAVGHMRYRGTSLIRNCPPP